MHRTSISRASIALLNDQLTMILFLALLSLALAAPEMRLFPRATLPSAMKDFRIIGGAEVDPVGKYPWQGGLEYFGSHYCGCVYIGDDWVLTAAHCAENAA